MSGTAGAQQPSLRPLRDGDGRLLAMATLGNLNWSEERFTAAQVAADPRLRHYVDGWLADRDFGVVAEVHPDAEGAASADRVSAARPAGGPVGVAWALHLPAGDPGYGFVDEATPEVSLWVAPAHRGTGIGTRLLAEVIAQARDRGEPGLSLSVEAGNPARRLYERAGFAHADGHDEGTLLLRLRDAAR